VDVQTVDNEYQQLQQEQQETVQTIQALAGKLQTGTPAADTDVKEWLLDLKSIALQVQQEQLQMQTLLQAIHAYAANAVQQMPQQQYQPAPVAYAQPAAPAQQQGGGGGGLGRFFGGNFGHAMESGVGMGAGFGLSNAIIGSIFGN
jgi:hypothetical protein